MIPIEWSESEKILTISSKRSLRSVLDRIRGERPAWVVVRRAVEWQPEPYFYALLPIELLRIADEQPHDLDRTVEVVLELRETGRSTVTRGARPAQVELEGAQGPPAGRAVHLDAEGRPSAVGEGPGARRTMRGGTAPRGGSPPGRDTMGYHSGTTPLDLGPTRGGSGSRGGAPPAPSASAPGSDAGAQPATVEVTISAETREEIAVNAVETVKFRIELKGEAMPLRNRIEGDVTVETDKKIRVLITTFGDAIEVLDSPLMDVDAPATGQPSIGAFPIQAVKTGTAEIALLFRQGGTQLGSIRFAVSVVASAPRPGQASGQATAEPRDLADDDMLVLLIEQRMEGDKIRYEYRLHSEALGLNYLPLNSAPLLGRSRSTP